MSKILIKEKLITNGVRNLIEFGYPNVDRHNIFTDEVYSLMFVSMLKDNKGHGEKIDEAIDDLMNEIRSKSTT